MGDFEINEEELKLCIARIEKLEEEKKEITDLIRETYAQAKNSGLDPSIIKRVISIKRRQSNDVKKENTLLSTYLRIIGVYIE